MVVRVKSRLKAIRFAGRSLPCRSTIPLSYLPTMTPLAALDHLWTAAGCDAAALDAVSITGSDPALPSVYRVGTLAASTIAATGLVAAECLRLRTGLTQRVEVDV